MSIVFIVLCMRGMPSVSTRYAMLDFSMAFVPRRHGLVVVP
jgi:hypothetical protein